MVHVNKEDIIKELQESVSDCDREIDSVLNLFSWTKQHLEKDTTLKCAYDKGHRVHASSLKKHEDVCHLITSGSCTRHNLDCVPPSSEFFYEKAKNIYSCILDKEKLNRIIREASQNDPVAHIEKELPLTGDDSIVSLTPTERLHLYQHVVNEARTACYPVSEVVDDALIVDHTKIHKATEKGEPEMGKMSAAEYVMAMRDYKRRRQTYRAKNVHITQKSYTEVIREVIQNQTENLADAMSEQQETETATVTESTSRSQSRGRSRSRDRRRSRSRTRSRSTSYSGRRSSSRSRHSSKDRKRHHLHKKHRHKSHRRH